MNRYLVTLTDLTRVTLWADTERQAKWEALGTEQALDSFEYVLSVELIG